MADPQNAIQQGLEAAKAASQDKSMTQQVEELANQLQQQTTTGNQDEDGNGIPLAAKDGFRYDSNDSSDFK